MLVVSRCECFGKVLVVVNIERRWKLTFLMLYPASKITIKKRMGEKGKRNKRNSERYGTEERSRMQGGKEEEECEARDNAKGVWERL